MVNAMRRFRIGSSGYILGIWGKLLGEVTSKRSPESLVNKGDKMIL